MYKSVFWCRQAKIKEFEKIKRKIRSRRWPRKRARSVNKRSDLRCKKGIPRRPVLSFFCASIRMIKKKKKERQTSLLFPPLLWFSRTNPAISLKKNQRADLESWVYVWDEGLQRRKKKQNKNKYSSRTRKAGFKIAR